MTTYTPSSYVYAKAVFDDLTTGMVGLGLQAVYYGDQNKIPVTPVACVEPGPKQRTLRTTSYGTELNLTTYVLIYNDMLTDKQNLFELTDQLAETVEAYLNGKTYGDIVIFGFVTSLEPGYAQKGAALYRVSRLTLEAKSLQNLTKS